MEIAPLIAPHQVPQSLTRTISHDFHFDIQPETKIIGLCVNPPNDFAWQFAVARITSVASWPKTAVLLMGAFDENLEVLKKAIDLRLPIAFEYLAPDHVKGERIGNVHAVFIHPTTQNINMDIFKTGGVSTDTSKPLPDWRQYKLKHISKIVLLTNLPTFEPAARYNPVSPQYARVIFKI
jgi:hypothetical protein